MANKENENNNSSTSLNIGQKVEKIKEQAGLEIDDLKQFKNNQEISSDIEMSNCLPHYCIILLYYFFQETKKA